MLINQETSDIGNSKKPQAVPLQPYLTEAYVIGNVSMPQVK